MSQHARTRYACKQVHRIQNKLLWQAYAGNRFAMKGRWRNEPNLPHINGGGSMLWHGTGRRDPWLIFAAEHGEQLSSVEPCNLYLQVDRSGQKAVPFQEECSLCLSETVSFTS